MKKLQLLDRTLDEAANEKGMSRFDVGLIIAVVAVLLCIVLGFVWVNGSKGKDEPVKFGGDPTLSQPAASDTQNITVSIKTFADCKKAEGSRLLQTSPAQCVTKDGKKFTDKAAVNSSSFESAGTMPIDAWGIQMPIPKTTPGLSYEIIGSDQMTLFVKSLETNPCKGAVGTIERTKTSGSDAGVGGYTYKFVAPAQVCSTEGAMKTTEARAHSDFAQAAKLITVKD